MPLDLSSRSKNSGRALYMGGGYYGRSLASMSCWKDLPPEMREIEELIFYKGPTPATVAASGGWMDLCDNKYGRHRAGAACFLPMCGDASRRCYEDIMLEDGSRFDEYCAAPEEFHDWQKVRVTFLRTAEVRLDFEA